MDALPDRETVGVEAQPPRLYTVVSFEAFYREHFRPVFRTAVALTRDPMSAEDLTQDAFLVARRRWEEISQYDRPDLFVRRVVINRSRSRFRSFARELKARVRLEGRDRAAEMMPDPVPEVWAAISALPARQAQVVVLVILADLSVGDVAEILDCGTETVRTHLRRAKRRLAQTLEDADERR